MDRTGDPLSASSAPYPFGHGKNLKNENLNSHPEVISKTKSHPFPDNIRINQGQPRLELLNTKVTPPKTITYNTRREITASLHHFCTDNPSSTTESYLNWIVKYLQNTFKGYTPTKLGIIQPFNRMSFKASRPPPNTPVSEEIYNDQKSVDQASEETIHLKIFPLNATNSTSETNWSQEFHGRNA
ncbi:unnamed protein product [Mucor circinelloides]